MQKINHLLKNKKYLTSNGYIRIFSPKHPRQHKGFVYEHILEVEKKIGRFLRKKEMVHHLNEIKSDNRSENLYLCKDQREHSRIHAGWEKINGEWWRNCGGCKKKLKLKNNFYFRKNGLSISKCKKCNDLKKATWWKKNKCKNRILKVNEGMKKEIIKLRKQGFSFQKIGNKFSISKQLIMYHYGKSRD